MRRLWIKVCGLRTTEALAATVDAGVDAVGFVFYAASPRHLAAAEARVMAAAVPPGIEKVAVFLHPTQAEVDAAIDAVHPDWVQADAADLVALRLPAGQRVLPVYRTGQSLPLPQDLPQRFLLESGRSGAGERADWTQAAHLGLACELVLAGGLEAGNVADAIAAVRPFGIDVSSGVESTRGVKDAALIRNFVSVARAAQARATSLSLGVMQQ